MSSELYYWFYSTSAQVLGALIGLLGIFAVYALQQINNLIEFRRRDLGAYFSRPSPGTNRDFYSLDVLLNATESPDYFSSLKSNETLEQLKSEVYDLQHKHRNIRHRTVGLCGFLAFLLSLSLICLHICQSKLSFCPFWHYILKIELIGMIVSFVFIGLFVSNTLMEIKTGKISNKYK